MVCEVSRLSRSVKEFCGMLETIQQKHLQLMILGSITVDCREGQMDPMSTAFLQMASIFNQLELSLIRERVRSGVANAKAKGKQIGRKPTTKDDIPAVFYSHRGRFLLTPSQSSKNCLHILWKSQTEPSQMTLKNGLPNTSRTKPPHARSTSTSRQLMVRKRKNGVKSSLICS